MSQVKGKRSNVQIKAYPQLPNQNTSPNPDPNHKNNFVAQQNGEK